MSPILIGLLARAAAVRLAFVLATALLAAFPPAAAGLASAIAPPLAAVGPGPHGYFEYTLAPGQSTTPTIAIRHQGAATARYTLYVARATTAAVSGVAYGQPTARPVGTAAWLTPSLLPVSLAGRERPRIRFHLTVPAGTRPGDYLTAIAAQPPAPTATRATSAGNRSVRFLVTARTVLAVVIHVPGHAAAAARFDQPRVWLQQHVRQVLTIRIHDTGAVLMKPYLAGVLGGCAARRAILRLDRQLDTFVPHTSIDYPAYLNHHVLTGGCYRVTLALYQWHGGPRLAAYTSTLHIGQATTRIRRPATPHATSPRSKTPVWLLAVALAALLLVLTTGGLLLRARRERARLLEQLARADARAAADDRSNTPTRM